MIGDVNFAKISVQFRKSWKLSWSERYWDIQHTWDDSEGQQQIRQELSLIKREKTKIYDLLFMYK